MSAPSGPQRLLSLSSRPYPAIGEMVFSGLGEMMDGELGCGRGRAGPTRSNLQRTGATTIDPRWQLCRATLRHTA
jgi:hypothetical protein